MTFQYIPDISARQLAAVLAIAEYRSFIAAAAHLKVSQPTLTRSIKRTEDVLGVRLFERTTRTVRLTEAGREFVAVAQRISNDLRIVSESLREIADQQRGQVIISAIMSVANGFLPGLISQYRMAHPGIEIRILDGVHGDVVEAVKNGAADFGITYLQDTPDGLAATRLGQGVFDLVVSKRSPLGASGKTSLRFEELAGMDLVSMPQDSQTRRVLDAAAAVRGIRLNHAVVVSQVPTLLSLVHAGVGVGLAPSASVTGDLGYDLTRLTVCEPSISLDVGVIVNGERSLSPAASGLYEMIVGNWPKD